MDKTLKICYHALTLQGGVDSMTLTKKRFINFIAALLILEGVFIYVPLVFDYFGNPTLLESQPDNTILLWRVIPMTPELFGFYLFLCAYAAAIAIMIGVALAIWANYLTSTQEPGPRPQSRTAF